MTYKEAIKRQCEEYARDPQVRFIGYNTVKGSRMYGTLDGVPAGQCIEMPVCEGLMMGMALGMSRMGFKPVVCFERHDFMLLALDQLVNHADKLPYISGYQYRFDVVVRAIVGASRPLDPGVQHRQDYSHELGYMFTYTNLYDAPEAAAWHLKYGSGVRVIIEYKDMYDEEID